MIDAHGLLNSQISTQYYHCSPLAATNNKKANGVWA